MAWLGERGVEGEELHEVLAALAEEGAIDDERFARRYAEDKRELRGWGPDRIAEALHARGVERSLIEAALAGEDEGETVARALALLEGGGAYAGGEAGRARALGLLARRGYPVDTAYEAVRALERRSDAA
ncbi:MAG: RecX family transcriptional regulator [Actinobacteria bacterium]|nr:RecX family transcriptional regulator [Actinomycetota bacterium]